MMAYFLIFAAAASAVASPPSAELRKLPVSELRAMLDARGVECKACVEKKHWVARVRKTWKRPIVKKAGGIGFCFSLWIFGLVFGNSFRGVGDCHAVVEEAIDSGLSARVVGAAENLDC